MLSATQPNSAILSLESFRELIPLLAVIAVAVVIIWLTNRIMLKRVKTTDGHTPRILTVLILIAVAVVAVIIALPLDGEIKSNLLTLLGLVLTAVIGLSSTTFVSNAMAGWMLRSVRCFRSGDFIRVGENFGRVTERGLFHTEIQTEDRDLTTLPNLYLISQPVTVVRTSGTIISATVSLGYDEPHGRIEALLHEAAEQAGLTDAFMQVLELGDFSITYRIAGFLDKVKHLITARSKLRRCMLDVLHGNGVEIVSPTFMNQRRLSPDQPVIPDAELEAAQPAPAADPLAAEPEAMMFDKADRAEQIQQWQADVDELKEQLKELHARLAAADETAKTVVERRIAWITRQQAVIEQAIADAQAAPPD
jgi:small conductance mechanosensitive channel